MAAVTIKLEGFKQLERALKELGPEVAKNGLRSSNYAGAKVIVEATKQEMGKADAPKVRTGLLKASIVAARRRGPETSAKHTVKVSSKSKVSKIGKARRGKHAGKYTQRAGPSIYGRFLEFGTSKMAAHPFLRPAFLDNQGSAIEAIRSGLRKAIDRAVKKRS